MVPLAPTCLYVVCKPGIRLNCGICPAELLHSISGMAQAHIDTPLIAKGNSEIPSYVDGATHYHGTPALMTD